MLWGKKKPEGPQAEPPKFDRDQIFCQTRLALWTLAIGENLAGKRNFAATEVDDPNSDAGQKFLEACYRAGVRLGFVEGYMDEQFPYALNQVLQSLQHDIGARDNVTPDLLSMYEQAWKRYKERYNFT